MRTIYLVRHARYQNPKKINPVRMKGFPLSPSGRSKATELGNYFKKKNIFAIYTSPILRTKETADIIGKILGIKPKINNLLIEVRTPFQGYKISYLHKNVKDVYTDPFHTSHGGETVYQIYDRMKKVIDFYLKKNKDKNIILVSHGDPIMAYYGFNKGKKVTKEKTFTSLVKPSYIPKGGVIKATFKDDGTLQEIKPVNY